MTVTSSISAEQLVTSMIALRASPQPESSALVAAEGSLAYGELEAQSNRLAHFLAQRGIGLEDLVAICLPRSFTSVLASLAVLKAGGAYLPIDPSHVSERLDFVLRDANPKLVIASEAMRTRLNIEPSRFVSRKNRLLKFSTTLQLRHKHSQTQTIWHM